MSDSNINMSDWDNLLKVVDRVENRLDNLEQDSHPPKPLVYDPQLAFDVQSRILRQLEDILNRLSRLEQDKVRAAAAEGTSSIT